MRESKSDSERESKRKKERDREIERKSAREKELPLGADKTHDASKGVFSVFSNDKNKNYDTIGSAWEFSKNQEQPQVSRLIRLEATLL